MFLTKALFVHLGEKAVEYTKQSIPKVVSTVKAGGVRLTNSYEAAKDIVNENTQGIQSAIIDGEEYVENKVIQAIDYTKPSVVSVYDKCRNVVRGDKMVRIEYEDKKEESK